MPGMLKIKSAVLAFFSVISLFFSTTPVLAGGGLVEWTKLEAWNGESFVNPGEAYIVRARVNLSNQNYSDGNINRCKQCPIKIKLEDPKPDDVFNPTSDKTDENGEVEVKVVSYEKAIRYVYAEVVMPEGNVYTGSKAVLNFTGQTQYWNPSPLPTPSTIPMPGAPEMVYPQDRQTLDLEGAFMFKIKPVEGASGYLFGLFQDGVMVYENYRDTKTLSSNGEFALWEGNPAHAKFHTGEVKVMIRAYVRNQWTDAREIFINLRPRVRDGILQPVGNVSQSPLPQTSIPTPPAIQPSQVVAVTDSSASAALQNKVDELEKKLEASQQEQSALRVQLNQIISWIKSIFPFFN